MILVITFERDGRLAKSALELVSAARSLAEAGNSSVVGAVFGADPAAAAAELARYLPDVKAVASPALAPLRAEAAAAAKAPTDGDGMGDDAEGQPTAGALAADGSRMHTQMERLEQLVRDQAEELKRLRAQKPQSLQQ